MNIKCYWYFIMLFMLMACMDHAHASQLSSRVGPPLTIRGRITDELDHPMPGVNVTLKGTRVTAITDENGNYTIQVASGTGTLVFSFVGYVTKEVPIGTKTTVNLQMVPDQNSLNQVVVIGYGTQRQRELTSAVGTLKGGEVTRYNSQTFQTALQGQLPGVDLSESSGVPGAAVNIRIRGLASINGSAGPLYVVDGVPVFQGASGDGDAPQNNGFDQTSSGTNVMTDINPNDIESIEVLKDAASSAIYGARGSGGVILITTKRGKLGQTSFNVNLTSGFTNISSLPKLLNGPQLLEILDEAYRNTFYSIPANANLPLPPSPLPPVGLTRGRADSTNNNAFDHVIQTGTFQELTLSATNGTDQTKYYIGGTYRNSEGTIKGTGMKQFNFKLNVDHQLTKGIKIGLSLTPSFNRENKLGSSGTLNLGGYGGALSTNLPIYPYYNDDGTYFNPWTNPDAFLDRKLYDGQNKRTRIAESAYIEARLTKSLSLRSIAQREDFSQIGPTYISGLLRINNDLAVTPFANDQTGFLGFQNTTSYANSFDSYFTYKKVIAKNHNLDAILGMRFSTSNQFFEAMYGDGLINSYLLYPSLTARVQQGVQTGAQPDVSSTLGYYARAIYNYKRRYLLSAIVNRDGSSRFGDNKRFGTFPAFSAGWIVSDHQFLKNSKIISFLKIRGSFGLTGNSGGIGNLASKTRWQSGTLGYMNTVSNRPNAPANLSLQWEMGTKSDVGLDLGLFKGKINATVDVYKNKTTKMLLSIPTPMSFGYEDPGTELTYLENRGSLYNKGIEFSVNAQILDRALKWRTSFNITHNETRILSLGGLDPNTVSGGSGDVQLYPGRSAPVYYLIEWAGVDWATGSELIRDKNNKVVLATSLTPEELNAARKPQWDKPPAPKFYGGFINNFSYKSLGLNIVFAYRYGNYLLDAGERTMSYVGNIAVTNNGNAPNIFLGNLPVSILRRWTPDNNHTDIPKVYYNDGTNNPLRGRNTTRFLSDASYLRLKNVQFTYNLPRKTLSRLKLKSAQLNITGQNLLTFTRFKGTDPEAATIQTNYRERNIAYGVIRNVVPQSKSLTLGLNVGF